MNDAAVIAAVEADRLHGKARRAVELAEERVELVQVELMDARMRFEAWRSTVVVLFVAVLMTAGCMSLCPDAMLIGHHGTSP